MHYKISYNPEKHILDITLTIKNIKTDDCILNLPSWRPGRYELANFSKNIYKVTAENQDGHPLGIEKVSKDSWKIIANNPDTITVRYQYYANQPDAGGSVADGTQLYINFINCMMYANDSMNESCEVELDIPNHYKIACGLKKSGPRTLQAENYYHLVDSPLIASADLKELVYKVENHLFHIWINGTWEPDQEKIIAAFKNFTAVQISTMGSFPCPEYHFLFQILRYKFYHGVEHYNSTVITLGPSEDMNSEEAWENILGISSHELFHTWNIIRIRPKEMLPYDFSKENYFKTGYVAEGFTTYFGDIFLLRSKVFSPYDYFNLLNNSLKRHLENFGRNNMSLTDSSYDLWLDGYSAGIPNRKVSIYVKGSLVALMLDLTIRKNSRNKFSLDDVMRELWNDFGATGKGYAEIDVQHIAEKFAGTSLADFFSKFIYGTFPIEENFSSLLHNVGYSLAEKKNESLAESKFGFKTQHKDFSTIVSAIAPGSDAEKLLSKDDEIIAVDGRKINNNLEKLLVGKHEIKLTLFRNHQLMNIQLVHNDSFYFRQLVIVKDYSAPVQAKENFLAWTGHEW